MYSNSMLTMTHPIIKENFKMMMTLVTNIMRLTMRQKSLDKTNC
jgi:hypothetical protein